MKRLAFLILLVLFLCPTVHALEITYTDQEINIFFRAVVSDGSTYDDPQDTYTDASASISGTVSAAMDEDSVDMTYSASLFDNDEFEIYASTSGTNTIDNGIECMAQFLGTIYANFYVESDEYEYFTLDFSIAHLDDYYSSADIYITHDGEDDVWAVASNSTEIGSVILPCNTVFRLELNFYNRILCFDDALETISTNGYFTASLAASPVPEPATITLLGVGLAGFLARRKFSKNI